MTRTVSFARMRNTFGAAVVALAVLLGTAATVGAQGSPSATGTTMGTMNGMNGMNGMSETSQANQATYVYQWGAARLIHSPIGYAHLLWNASTHTLTVTVVARGLAPNSTHPMHIHNGQCGNEGSIAYALNNLKANAAGDATSTTTISNVANGIPSSGWMVMVHNGPTMATPAEMTAIACTNVYNRNTNPNYDQSVWTGLHGTTEGSQNGWGYATLRLRGTTMTVDVYAFNLEPNTSHAEHIHAGTCQAQTPGNVVYPLPTLNTDANGNAHSQLVIQNVKNIPSTGWYVNVHRSANLMTQTGFDPVLCGNVMLG